jgi:DNA-binding transcriptional LysR family regulator
MDQSMDRFAALEAFVRVAEGQSFSEAARQLSLSPSVVSKRLSDLEHDLGATLLRRTTRQVSLTAAGEILLEHAGAALASLDDARRELGMEAASPGGRLRISAPTSFGSLVLAPAVCEFRRLHEDIRVELMLKDGPVNPATEGFDLALDDSSNPAPSAIASRLAAIARVTVASPEYLQRRGAPRMPRDLERHDCIHYSELESGSSWRFRRPRGGTMDVRVAPVLASNNGRVMLDAVRAGQGIAVLPAFLVREDLAAGSLRQCLSSWRIPEVPLVLLVPRSAYTPLRTRLMRDFLVERFRVSPPPY